MSSCKILLFRSTWHFFNLTRLWISEQEEKFMFLYKEFVTLLILNCEIDNDLFNTYNKSGFKYNALCMRETIKSHNLINQHVTEIHTKRLMKMSASRLKKTLFFKYYQKIKQTIFDSKAFCHIAIMAKSISSEIRCTFFHNIINKYLKNPFFSAKKKKYIYNRVTKSATLTKSNRSYNLK